jgi:antitoxin HigA-1
MKNKILEMDRAEKWLQLETIRPGQLMVRNFMRPRDITPARLANESGVPLVHITEIIEGKRAITPQIAKRVERCFGWPAAVLLYWQLLYDIEVKLLGQETWLADATLHVRGQKMFLADVKNNMKILKIDCALIKKRLPARLRPTMRRHSSRTHRWSPPSR